MHKLIALACLAMALVVGPVLGATGVLLPPLKFDHEPKLPYTLRFASQEQVDYMCRYDLAKAAMIMPGELHASGCTDPVKRLTLISRDVSKEVQLDTWRHERAHLNGWRHE